MKRELGIARCGLACCLCTENVDCNGCGSNGCPDNDSCENKKYFENFKLKLYNSASNKPIFHEL